MLMRIHHCLKAFACFSNFLILKCQEIFYANLLHHANEYTKELSFFSAPWHSYPTLFHPEDLTQDPIFSFFLHSALYIYTLTSAPMRGSGLN